MTSSWSHSTFRRCRSPVQSFEDEIEAELELSVEAESGPLSVFSDLDEMRSTSVEGYSSITVSFQSTVDVQEALTQVREAVRVSIPRPAATSSGLRCLFPDERLHRPRRKRTCGRAQMLEVGATSR